MPCYWLVDVIVLRIRIRDTVLFVPWIQDPDPGSGMNIPDLIIEN